MVSNFPMQSYFRTPLTVDTTQAQKFFGDDEDASILDDAMLDQSAIDSGPEMSSPTSRRESFAVSSTLFSPKTEADWQSVEMQSVPSTSSFLDQHSTDAFMHQHQHQHQQQQAFAASAWPAVGGSSTATPLHHAFEGVPASDYESGMSMFPRPALPLGQTPFSNPNNQVPVFSQATGQDTKGQAAPRRDRGPASPSLLPSHNELRRGDGIRKKNARFEIPPERNLNNIDMLISQSQDDQEIKELKQQKRLLRNRQAALDSRQRKKQHTERLEDEKKHDTEVISSLSEENVMLKRDLDQCMREKAYVEGCVMELERQKGEMISQHTIQTGELRKKINVLTNHIQSLEGSTAMPGQPMQGHFLPHHLHAQGQNPLHQPFPTAGFGDLGGMSGLDVSWPGLSFGHFQPDPTEAQPGQPADNIKQEMQHVVASEKPDLTPPTTTPSTPTDLVKPSHSPPQQGGLLFMLFLVGAFVLSRSTPPSIPRVPDDVRAASATLLESVLRDAGATTTTTTIDEGMASLTSASASASWPSASAMDGVASPSTTQPSVLGRMADALTQPTPQQTNEQLFGLSAAQYNGVVDGHAAYHMVPPQPRSTSQGRRNLAEALASMQGAKAASVADVYTRSLLWDQIPGDVVRDFARMMAESSRTTGDEGEV